MAIRSAAPRPASFSYIMKPFAKSPSGYAALFGSPRGSGSRPAAIDAKVCGHSGGKSFSAAVKLDPRLRPGVGPGSRCTERRAMESDIAADDRQFVEAVLPQTFGNWNSIFRRFRRWATKDVFERALGLVGPGWCRRWPTWWPKWRGLCLQILADRPVRARPAPRAITDRP